VLRSLVSKTEVTSAVSGAACNTRAKLLGNVINGWLYQVRQLLRKEQVCCGVAIKLERVEG
jgi:hypothetical protein